MKLLLVILLLVPQLTLAHQFADRIIAAKKPTEKFIVADKEQGKIFIIDPIHKTEIESGALYGKLITDKVDITYYDRKETGSPFITPAGVYPVTKMYSDVLQKNMLVFYEGTYIVMAIHPVYTGNVVQKREERLVSDDPKLHRITNGCINVSSEFFNNELNKLPDNTLLYILPETELAKADWDKYYPELNNTQIRELSEQRLSRELDRI